MAPARVDQGAGQSPTEGSQTRSGGLQTSGWTRRSVLLVSLMTLAAAAGAGYQAPSPQLKLLDLQGRQVDPFGQSDARATVFIFLRSDCPISNRYAPEVRRLTEKFAHSSMTFWLVYPDPDESAGTISKHVKEYDYRLRVLRDPRKALVKMTGVRVTPEAAVFLSGGRMVYRGRIDDRYVDFGKVRPAPTTRDLEQVLEAIVEGRTVASKTTPAVGCFISQSQ